MSFETPTSLCRMGYMVHKQDLSWHLFIAQFNKCEHSIGKVVNRSKPRSVQEEMQLVLKFQGLLFFLQGRHGHQIRMGEKLHFHLGLSQHRSYPLHQQDLVCTMRRNLTNLSDSYDPTENKTQIREKHIDKSQRRKHKFTAQANTQYKLLGRVFTILYPKVGRRKKICC